MPIESVGGAWRHGGESKGTEIGQGGLECERIKEKQLRFYHE